jgi:sugar phosphate isomerase/epimerase
MDRRQFISGTAAAGAAMAAQPGPALAQAGARVPLGVQFFTFVGGQGAAMGWEKYSAAMATVRGIGYDGIELAGFSGYKPDVLRKRADDLGLAIPSVHIGFDQVFGFLPPPPFGPDTFSQAQDVVYSPVGVVQIARALGPLTRDVGARFATIAGGGTLNFKTVDNIMRFADGLNQANAIVRPMGLTLSWHPHAPEFTKLAGGQEPMDLIVRNTDPTIRYELDVYWSTLGSGETPAATIARLGGRLGLFHLKDMDKDKKIATPGDGTFDFAAIKTAALAKVANPYFFVERDGAPDPIDAATRSYAFLRKLGYGVRA